MSSAGPNPSKTREFLGNFQTTELLPLSVGFKGGVTFPLRQTPHPGSSQSAPDVHSGRQAGLDKLCAEGAGGGEGADKDASGSPTAQGLFISNPAAPTPESAPSFILDARPAELTESARPSKGTRSQRGRLSACWVAAMQRWQRLPEEAPLGGRCLSPGGKGRCR